MSNVVLASFDIMSKGIVGSFTVAGVMMVMTIAAAKVLSKKK